MLITGLSTPVFPLNKVDTYLSGYYMDSEGAVYSTKSRFNVTKLAGTHTTSGRYYTLNKRTHRAVDLARRARAHPSFIVETSLPKVVLLTANASLTASATGLPPGRTKSARDASDVKGYLLATVGPTDRLIFGTDPVFHLSDVTAKAEAERVAGESGKEVVLLKIVGKVKVQKAVWE